MSSLAGSEHAHPGTMHGVGELAIVGGRWLRVSVLIVFFVRGGGPGQGRRGASVGCGVPVDFVRLPARYEVSSVVRVVAEDEGSYLVGMLSCTSRLWFDWFGWVGVRDGGDDHDATSQNVGERGELSRGAVRARVSEPEPTTQTT
jgi:hypothetical protein